MERYFEPMLTIVMVVSGMTEQFSDGKRNPLLSNTTNQSMKASFILVIVLAIPKNTVMHQEGFYALCWIMKKRYGQ